MILFLKWLLAHLLGDFIFQPTSWVKDKEQKTFRSPKLYLHLLIHLALLILLSLHIKYWLGIAVITLVHGLTDIAKLTFQNKKNKSTLFFVDQIIHIATILIVANLYTPFITDFIHSYSIEKIILLTICILLCTTVSSHIIRVLISRWSPENTEDKDDSLANAGSFIGMMERIMVFAFVISGNFSAVGFLLGAKSIFRFGDLTEAKDRKLTEYILIGTLLSFGIALLISVFYLKISKTL